MYWHFFTFATTIHDRVYLINRRFELFDFDLHGQTEFNQRVLEGGGVIMMGAHLGSFEAIRAVGRDQPHLRVTMVMHEGNARKINAVLAALPASAAKSPDPKAILEAAASLGEVAKAVGQNPSLAPRALEFYHQCAMGSHPTTVRAFCLARASHAGGSEPGWAYELPQAVRELAKKVKF